MKKKKEEEHENAERWLLSYADFITLLMAFFMILFSMASVDANKFKVLAQSLSLAFGAGSGKGGGGGNMLSNFNGGGISPPTPLQIKVSENSEFNSMIKLINQYSKEQGLEKSIHSSITERGLVINLADTVLFGSGKADLSEHSKEILDRLGAILFKSGRMVRVEGHTDNVPIHTVRYQSNWQLSTDRATNVIMYWISKYPEQAPKLSAAGYGQYRPIASNETVTGQALNRRVEIVVLRLTTNEN